MDDNSIEGEEYKARKGDVELFTWRKRLSSTRAPILLLVHGSSLSSLPTFDLTVPGKPDYSMMDWFVRRGFDVWTCDHEAYGRSTLTQSNSDVASGVADLESVSELISRETGQRRMHIYGLSSGALRAASFASAHPERVNRLALDGFVWTGDGSPTLAKRREGADYFRTHNRRPIDQSFIESIFLRDHPGTSDPDVMRACATAQLAYADSVPTGTYLDMTLHLPVVDPAKILLPTLVARGEYDGIASMTDLLAFFDRLPSSDKQFSVIPALAHLTSLGLERRRMWKVVHDFLKN
jgi:alpha-beta hydrolase superfamily lysophospholipase